MHSLVSPERNEVDCVGLNNRAINSFVFAR